MISTWSCVSFPLQLPPEPRLLPVLNERFLVLRTWEVSVRVAISRNTSRRSKDLKFNSGEQIRGEESILSDGPSMLCTTPSA